MVYTDLLFLFAFLPIATAFIMILSEPWEKNLAAVALSLIFIVWARPIYYALIILPVIVTYASARLYNKTKSGAIIVSAEIISLIFGGVFALISGRDATLGGAICSVGFLLFVLRSFMYLNDVKHGASPEKDFTALGAYLISYEFMLISPVKSYSELSEAIKTRKFKLSNLSLGMKNFVFGLSKVAILGLSFDRVRLAALNSDATPWVNAIIGLLAVIVETYILLDGYTQMSAGLACINGVPMVSSGVAIRPRASLIGHISDVYADLGEAVEKHFGKSAKANIVGLVVCSLIAGAAIALENGAVAFFALVLAALMISNAPSEQKSGLFDFIVSLVLALGGFLLLANGSASGVAGWFASLNPNNYEFDISYALYDELTRVIPWLVIGIVSITPLPEMFASVFRARMSENEKFYSIARALGTCMCVLLLLISIIALVSFSR